MKSSVREERRLSSDIATRNINFGVLYSKSAKELLTENKKEEFKRRTRFTGWLLECK